MNVLIVDDHLMTIKGYKTILEKENPNFNFHKALNCEGAYGIVSTIPSLDIAILDYQLPEFKEKELYSGIDIALLIKMKHPTCKLIMITAYQEATIVYDIYNKVHPDALIIKSDISYSTFKECLGSKTTYLSTAARKAINIINNNDVLFNDINREILFYLKQGFKINEMDQYVPLTTVAFKSE